MKNRVSLSLLALAFSVGCHSPIAPTSERTQPEEVVVTPPPAPPAPTVQPTGPVHHNIPATLPDGRVVWVCETQDREYYNPSTGQSGVERDHYIQFTECPATPIE